MEKRQVIKVLLPTIIAVSIVGGMFIGRYFQTGDTSNQYVIYPRTDKISDIINTVSRDYVDKIEKKELIEATIPKILEDLDPHSQYIPASAFEEVNEPLEGNFDGIGVQFNMLNDTLIVIKAIEKGPSEKVGILPGDRFIVINGDTVAGVHMPSDSIVSKLKGPRGTEVMVEVLRNSVKKLIPFTIIRDQIPLNSLDVAYMINSETGYIKISNFSKTTHIEFNDAANKLLDKGMKKLIFDLRGNTGGLLQPAVNITNQFLEKDNLIVYTEGYASPRQNYYAKEGGLLTDIDLVVLIDEGSASASEILAGAIQDNDRGLIIGRRSFGKGLVQKQEMLSDGSALRLTIARYYTPTGRCIQKSYENGTQDYYNELNIRFEHGEYLEKDSINFTDTSKYITPAGRIVFGGGGIMPDVFVPIDTIGISDYFITIRNHGLIYRYSLEFADTYRDKLSTFKSLNEILTFIDSKKTFNNFIAFAEKNGVARNNADIKISREIIDTQIKAYIVRNILDDEGFYPVLEKIDNTLQIAIKEITKGVNLNE